MKVEEPELLQDPNLEAEKQFSSEINFVMSLKVERFSPIEFMISYSTSESK
jgi:hypothetical protein